MLEDKEKARKQRVSKAFPVAEKEGFELSKPRKMPKIFVNSGRFFNGSKAITADIVKSCQSTCGKKCGKHRPLFMVWIVL